MTMSRNAGRVVFALTFGALISCSASKGGSAPVPVSPGAPVVLEVRNNASFDVVIYAVPYAADAATRIATVSAFSARQLRVPHSALRLNDVLALRLHAIGSRYQWSTPELVVSQGLMACLEVNADYSGNLSRSVFYSAVHEDTTAQLSVPHGLCGREVSTGAR
ncbi:MAG: hypothetical protein U0132_20405 [Gemmatimonadaceae bacterium]